MDINVNIIVGVLIAKLIFDLIWAAKVLNMKREQFENDIEQLSKKRIWPRMAIGLIYSGRTITTWAILLKQIVDAKKKIKETDKQIEELKKAAQINVPPLNS